MISCARLQRHDWRVFYPGHGAPVNAPAKGLDWLVTHRKAREASILAALQQAPADAATLAQSIYTETPPALLGAATRNVLAHLVDLTGKSIIASRGEMSARAIFEPV